MVPVPGFEAALSKAFTLKKVHRDNAETTINKALEMHREQQAKLEADRQKKKEKAKGKKKKTKRSKRPLTFIGIHSRRTDHLAYEKERGRNPLKVSYFIEAMDKFRSKFKNVIFLYISDDLEWGKMALAPRIKQKDVFFVGSGEPSGSMRSVGVL